MGIVFGWIVLAVVVGMVASSNGRSFIGYTFLSLALSPILGLIILLISSVNKPAHAQAARASGELPVADQRCKKCGLEFDPTATVCPYCGTEV